jgi:hypothetical protein
MIRTAAKAILIVFAILLLIAEVQRKDDTVQVQADKAQRPVEYADLEQLPRDWK